MPVPTYNTTYLLNVMISACVFCAPFFIVAMFVAQTVGSKARLRILSRIKRPLTILVVALLALWTLSIALEVWPNLSIARGDALRVANEFMMDLKQGDAMGAASKMTPEAREAIAGDDGYQLATVHRPMDWEITSFDGFEAKGKVTFADGQELLLEIDMQWRYTGWYIYGLAFGPRSAPRIDWLISD